MGFVSDPISPLHLARGLSRQLLRRMRTYSLGGEDLAGGRLWAYVPGALVTPHNWPVLDSRFVHQNWNRFTVPNLVKRAQARGFGEVDLLYFDCVHHQFWLDAIKHRNAVYRMGDRMGGFHKWATPIACELQRSLATRVDLVLYSAKTLEADVKALGPKAAQYFPNGVDFKHFAEATIRTPSDIAGIRRPIAIYIGAMEEWFDFQLLNAAAARLHDVSFVLLGPDNLARRKLQPCGNLHILGPRAFDELPNYLYHADVGLIPFNVREHQALVNSVNPLKLYEYMACGLPVVSVRWRELELMNTPAHLADGTEQFLEYVRRATRYDGRREECILYASRQDWSARARQLHDLLTLS